MRLRETAKQVHHAGHVFSGFDGGCVSGVIRVVTCHLLVRSTVKLVIVITINLIYTTRIVFKAIVVVYLGGSSRGSTMEAEIRIELGSEVRGERVSRAVRVVCYLRRNI